MRETVEFLCKTICLGGLPWLIRRGGRGFERIDGRASAERQGGKACSHEPRGVSLIESKTSRHARQFSSGFAEDGQDKARCERGIVGGSRGLLSHDRNRGLLLPRLAALHVGRLDPHIALPSRVDTLATGSLDSSARSRLSLPRCRDSSPCSPSSFSRHEKIRPSGRPYRSRAAPREDGRHPKRAILGKVLGWGFVACAVVVGAFAARNMLMHPRSGTETKVMANAIGIAPRVSGPIKSLPLKDDQEVKKGDVLFEIDPEPYELAARVARANRDAVAGEILNVERAIAAQKANVLAAQAVLAQAETARTQAEDSLRRVEPLLAKNYATADSVEKARNARDTAVAAVNAAQAQLSAAEFAVQDVAPLQAKLKAAEAALAEAELIVRDCTVRAPFDGRVAGLDISVGAFARTAIDVLTLIDTGDWHVEANFRESELRRIQAGDRAEVRIMTAPARLHRRGGKCELGRF